MIDSNRWLLPEGIEEVLPPEAWHAETLRRRILDLYHSWGYELVIPPFIEYLESLLTGIGSDLDIQTFKVTDQLTGRLMGVRADMTPQVARIDAHSFKHEGPARFCYAGSVLHTRAASMLSTRSPIQLGAELYGCDDMAADREIIGLMLETVKQAGVTDIHLDLGQVAIYRGLVEQAKLEPEVEKQLFDLLQSKAKADVEEFVEHNVSDKAIARMLAALVRLNGGRQVLDEARALLAKAPQSVLEALDMLQDLAESVADQYPDIDLYFDLAELRGYRYHTGLVYSAYVQNYGQAIAKGGRYDHIGEVFGRARSATGFSADLKALMRLSAHSPVSSNAILAPNQADAALRDAVSQLRAQGERVVYALPGSTSGEQYLVDRKLIQEAGAWVVKPV